MNSFKDFGIKPQSKSFEGDKIKIDRILNKQVTVLAYKIEASKYDKGTGKCLYIQVLVDNSKRVLFTGSANLMDMIEQVPKDKFPFKTTIIKENERFEFT
jgi:hypothetical protein